MSLDLSKDLTPGMGTSFRGVGIVGIAPPLIT